MKDGYVQQIATPKEMFDNPENLFVAGFIGTPPMNFADGYIDENLEYFVHESGLKLKLTPHQHEILCNYAGKQVKFAVRAEYVYIDDASLQKFADSSFTIQVDYTEFLGAYTLIYGLFGEQPIISKVYQRNNIVDKEIKACFDMEKVHFFDIETTKRIR
jgi:multiple sugar transport system ATP-binding protein